MATSPRTRKEPSKEEIAIRGNAVSAQIRKDFLTKDVTYVPTKELPFLVGKIRQTANTKTDIRIELRENFDATPASVGNGMVAIVKRNPKS